MSSPQEGDRFVASRRVRCELFRLNFRNVEKKDGSVVLRKGTVLTFAGVERGRIVRWWRFTAPTLPGKQIRINAEDAKRKLSPLDDSEGAADHDESAEESVSRPGPNPPALSVRSEIGVAEELQRFVALREAGALTQEEFEAQKARLLGTSTAEPEPSPGDEPATGDGRFDVYLTRAGTDFATVTAVLAVIRNLTGVGLAGAQRTLLSAPQRILEGVDSSTVTRAQALFEDVDAEIAMQAAGTPFSGQLGALPDPWYRRPTTYLKPLAFALLLFGLVSCLNWINSFEADAPSPPAQTVPPAPPAPSPAPAQPSEPPSTDALQELFDGLVAAATELADFVVMYEETGASVGTVEACLALEQGYGRFSLLPGLEGSLDVQMEEARDLYFLAQRDCRRAIEDNDPALLFNSVRTADEGFATIVALSGRLTS